MEARHGREFFFASFSAWSLPEGITMGILKLGYLEIRVKDIAKAAHYYTRVLGLKESARFAGKIYLKAWDEWEHHQLVLVEDPTPRAQSHGLPAREFRRLGLFRKSTRAARLPRAAGLQRRGARRRRGDPVHGAQ